MRGGFLSGADVPSCHPIVGILTNKYTPYLSMKFIPLMIVPLVFSVVSCKSRESGTTATAVAEATPYPIETCLVSDEKLGSMGKPYEFVYEGQQVKFCCKSCLPDFEKDPAKFLAKLK
jgi:YHS domain-containing protein